ncbi:phosphotransferase, partial [Micromonospora zhanjiangensis]
AALWADLAGTPAWAGPPTWVHGDPHPANLLLAEESVGLAAVLDFGDLNAGDPACDLAAAWLVFDADGRAVFRRRLAEVGGADADSWARGRAWALNIGSAIAVHSGDNPRMAAVGAHALKQVLLDE